LIARPTEGDPHAAFETSRPDGRCRADPVRRSVDTARRFRLGSIPFDVAGLARAEGGSANWVKFLVGLTSSVAAMGPQQVVREVRDQLYTNKPGGLAGNDDLGAMSSWYVWSALGAYPETPGSATLALGSPMFSRIAIHLGDGKTITESAPQADDDAPSVQSASVNGSSWDHAYLPASLVKQGGTVDWTLAATPSTAWAAASNDAPPSDTQGLLPALGYVSGPGGDADSMVVTQPGTSTTLTVGAQSMTNAAQTIS